MTCTADLNVFNRLWSAFFIFFVGMVDSKVAVFNAARYVHVFVSGLVINAVNSQMVLLVFEKFLVELLANFEQII